MRLSPMGLARLDVGRVVPLLAVMLEVLWAYPCLLWLSRWQMLGWPRVPLSLAGASGLAVAAEVIARTALARGWSLRRTRLVVLLSLTALLALVVRLELGAGYAPWDPGWVQHVLSRPSQLVVGLAFGAYLLWRGISVGRESLSFDHVYWRFVVGLTVLISLLLVWRVAGVGGQPASTGAALAVYVVAYFSVGLLAFAMTNLQSIRKEMLSHQKVSLLPTRQWILLMLAVVLALVVVSVGIASILSFDFAALLLRTLSVLADWLLLAFLYGVVLPVGLLAAGLVYALRFLVHVFGRGQPPQPLNVPDFSDILKSAKAQQAHSLPPEAVLALKWGLVALLVLLGVVLLAHALFRYRRTRAEDVEEVNESLWSWDTLKEDLRSFLAGLLRRFRPRRPATSIVALPPVAVQEGDDSARMLTVREIYRSMLWEGQRAGVPRRQCETPNEYRDKLERYVGPATLALGAITEAYVADRYGGVVIVGEPLGSLNRFWRSLRSVLRIEATGEERPPETPA